mmetsp:Transcript_74938/g.219533  ORF Transcript_74938/g.219533 Transcript_74938/m.219533 type:complete len:224 (-) Transcript_74938:8-679(-)
MLCASRARPLADDHPEHKAAGRGEARGLLGFVAEVGGPPPQQPLHRQRPGLHSLPGAEPPPHPGDPRRLAAGLLHAGGIRQEHRRLASLARARGCTLRPARPWLRAATLAGEAPAPGQVLPARRALQALPGGPAQLGDLAVRCRRSRSGCPPAGPPWRWTPASVAPLPVPGSGSGRGYEPAEAGILLCGLPALQDLSACESQRQDVTAHMCSGMAGRGDEQWL